MAFARWVMDTFSSLMTERMYSIALARSFWSCPAGAGALQWATVFMIGFFLYGPQMLIGLCGAELVGPAAVGASEGFLGYVAYLGAANAGAPLAHVVREMGWTAYFVTLLTACGLALARIALAGSSPRRWLGLLGLAALPAVLGLVHLTHTEPAGAALARDEIRRLLLVPLLAFSVSAVLAADGLGPDAVTPVSIELHPLPPSDAMTLVGRTLDLDDPATRK